MDCTLSVSSVCGLLQARILEWVAIPFSRGSSQPKDQFWVFCIAGRFFMSEPPKKPVAREVVENMEIHRKGKWVYMYVKKPYVINPNGQGSSTCWRFSVAAEVIPLKAFGGFWNRVYYCGRDILIVLTEVISRIFGFDVINCQGKIYVIPAATEPGWNPRDKSRSLFNNELRSLSWFLLVPVQVIIHFLAGFAGDSDSVSWSHWHRCWRLCEGYFCYSLYLREKIEKIIQKYHIQQEWQKSISYTNAFLGVKIQKREVIFLTRDPEEQEDEVSLGAHGLGGTFTCGQCLHPVNHILYMVSEMLRDLHMEAICK